jgi:PIN domain nuclease of toxin-antitoxin system
VLDTCVFIFLGQNPSRLSKKQIQIIENWENVLHISTASAYEIATKVRIGKLKLSKNTKDFWRGIIDEYEIQVHSIDEDQALSVESLPFDNDHRDPFDRLIAGFSRKWGMPILTTEEEFSFYGCNTIT